MWISILMLIIIRFWPGSPSGCATSIWARPSHADCGILYYNILCYTAAYFTMLYCNLLYYDTVYQTILWFTILYHTLLNYSILYHTIPHYTVPCLYYTTLHPILYTLYPIPYVLYSTILYYTLLYSTILYYTLLYSTILYYTTPYCRRTSTPAARWSLCCPAAWCFRPARRTH